MYSGGRIVEITKYGKVIISQNQGKNPNLLDETPFFEITEFHFDGNFGDDDEPLVWAWKALGKQLEAKYYLCGDLTVIPKDASERWGVT